MVTRGALGLFLRRRLPRTDVDLLLDTSAQTTLTTAFKKDQQQIVLSVSSSYVVAK